MRLLLRMESRCPPRGRGICKDEDEDEDLDEDEDCRYPVGGVSAIAGEVMMVDVGHLQKLTRGWKWRRNSSNLLHGLLGTFFAHNTLGLLSSPSLSLTSVRSSFLGDPENAAKT